MLRTVLRILVLFFSSYVNAQVFHDGFETGSYTPNWIPTGGAYNRSVVNIGSPVGSYNFEQTGGAQAHNDGVKTVFGPTMVSEVSWYVKASYIQSGSGYFVMGDLGMASPVNCIFFSYFTGGNFRLYANPTTIFEYPASPDTWYFIELKNFDWINKEFDIYVNGVLQSVDFPFRDPTINQAQEIHLYNYNNDFINSTANYDEINVFGTCTSTSISNDLPNLPNVTSECAITSLSPPTSTTNCGVSLYGVPDVSFPITTEGLTIVTWTYDDGNGNISTQTQTVIIDDITAPVADAVTLPNVNAECEVTSLTAPTATDNCAGTINGTHDASLPITAQGTTVVTWTFDDGNGNTSTQTQNIVITDVTAPSPDIATLADLTDDCEVTTLTEPTATDNCGGTVTVTNDATIPINALGTTVITWTYEDENGNTSTQTQNVVINGLTITASMVDDTTITADQTGDAFQWIDCDNGNQAITGETSQTLDVNANGNYAVVVTIGNCSDTSDCILIDYIGIKEQFSAVDLIIYPNPTNDGFMFIKYDGQINAIDIMDMTGRKVSSYVAIENNTIDASKLSTGNYLIHISTNEGVAVKEVTILR